MSRDRSHRGDSRFHRSSLERFPPRVIAAEEAVARVTPRPASLWRLAHALVLCTLTAACVYNSTGVVDEQVLSQSEGDPQRQIRAVLPAGQGSRTIQLGDSCFRELSEQVVQVEENVEEFDTLSMICATVAVPIGVVAIVFWAGESQGEDAIVANMLGAGSGELLLIGVLSALADTSYLSQETDPVTRTSINLVDCSSNGFAPLAGSLATLSSYGPTGRRFTEVEVGADLTIPFPLEQLSREEASGEATFRVDIPSLSWTVPVVIADPTGLRADWYRVMGQNPPSR
jgi:hypothetical protein